MHKGFISHYITREFDSLIARIALHSQTEAKRDVEWLTFIFELVTALLLKVIMQLEEQLIQPDHLWT